MGFCTSGTDRRLTNCQIIINVSEGHPLIKLANTLNWPRLTEMVLPDLKKTHKLKWWIGRKLNLRIHLGVYLLQQLLNSTDRGTENQIRYNALYQVFCGKTIVKNWHCPDHTKIEEFRSRLSPETQCFLANEVALLAAKKQFAKPENIDIDSTIQEPDMQHPSISNLLIKMAGMARNVQKLLVEKCGLDKLADKIPDIDMKKIKGLARQYFFIKRKKSTKNTEAKQQALRQLWQTVSQAGNAILRHSHWLLEPFIFESLNSWDQKLVTQFTSKASSFLSETFEHSFEHAPMNCKIFSFHRDEVDCFNKQKERKANEFGRQFQIGRIEGNFVWSIPNHSIRMNDPESLKPMVRGHLNLFQKPLESAGADKGYYSKDNEKFLLDLKTREVALQRPQRKLIDAPDNPISAERLEQLVNRRSGIEPIISHLKRRWQMGKSRMKSDRTTESSGYCAMLGFNLHQLSRYLSGEVSPKADQVS